MADGSFTRSLYIGKDKTAEVLKRKETVEKELMARREAKIREQEERIMRAKQQKELDNRERIRERHQRELERQKAVMDRRIAQLATQNAKKEEILKRNHQKVSRTANDQQKKPVYAFGSSTPRELSLLQQPRSARNNSTSRGTSPIQPPQQQPSRFQLSGHSAHAPAAAGHSSSVMTRSVFGTINNAGNNNRKQQQMMASSAGTRMAAMKRGPSHRQQPGASTSQLSSATAATAMTQSLYIPKPMTNNSGMVRGAARGGNNTIAPRAPTLHVHQMKKNKPVASFQEKPSTTAAEQQKPKPVIRPRKAVVAHQQKQQKENVVEEANNVVATAANMEEDAHQPDAPAAATYIVEQNGREEEEPVIHIQTVDMEQHENGPFDGEEQQEGLVDEGNNADEFTPNGQNNGENIDQLPQALEQENEEDHDNRTHSIVDSDEEVAMAEGEGKEQEEQMDTGDQNVAPNGGEVESMFDMTASTLIQREEQEEESFGSAFDSGDVTLVEEPEDKQRMSDNDNHSPDNGEAELDAVNRGKDTTGLLASSPQPPKSSSTAAAAIVVPPEQEEIRESRRRALNEILQRTRQEAIAANASAGMATAAVTSANNGMGILSTNIEARNGMNNSSTTSSLGMIGVANPLMSAANIDKAALAKELLAQRKLQKMQQQQKQKEVNLMDELVQKQPHQRPMALADELLAERSSDLFSGSASAFNSMNMNIQQQYYQLPGEMILTPHQQGPTALPPLFPLHSSLLTNTTTPLKANNTTAGGGEDSDGGDRTMRTPPEDPHMNERDQKQQEMVHPPEPNLI